MNTLMARLNPLPFKPQRCPLRLASCKQASTSLILKKKETVSVVSGALTVKLPNSDKWQTFHSGDNFIVDAHQQFQLKVDIDTAYLCTYE